MPERLFVLEDMPYEEASEAAEPGEVRSLGESKQESGQRIGLLGTFKLAQEKDTKSTPPSAGADILTFILLFTISIDAMDADKIKCVMDGRTGGLNFYILKKKKPIKD